MNLVTFFEFLYVKITNPFFGSRANAIEKSKPEPAQRLIEMAIDSYRSMDHELSINPPPLVNGTSIQCKNSCSWCCHVEVVVSLPEILAIFDKISNMPAEIQENIKNEITNSSKKIGNRKGHARMTARVKCPLLDKDGSCVVYELRPQACRGYMSYDVAACKKSWEKLNQRKALLAGKPQQDAVDIRQKLAKLASEYTRVQTQSGPVGHDGCDCEGG